MVERNRDHLEKIVCSLGIVGTFAYGASFPLWIDNDDLARMSQFLGDNSLVIVLFATGSLILSAVISHIFVGVASDQPALTRLLIKMFFLCLPATAAGISLSMLTGVLGIFKVSFHAWYVISALNFLIAGIVGITAMRTRSEYQQILQKKMVKSGEPNSAW